MKCLISGAKYSKTRSFSTPWLYGKTQLHHSCSSTLREKVDKSVPGSRSHHVLCEAHSALALRIEDLLGRECGVVSLSGILDTVSLSAVYS